MCGKGGLPLVSTLAAHGAPAMTHQQGCGGAAPPYPRGGSGWDQDPKTQSMDNFRATGGERRRFRTFRTRPEAIGDKGIAARIMTGRGPRHLGELARQQRGAAAVGCGWDARLPAEMETLRETSADEDPGTGARHLAHHRLQARAELIRCAPRYVAVVLLPRWAGAAQTV